MNNEEYIKRSNGIQKRIDILREQINECAKENRDGVDASRVRPLIDRHQQVIDEATALDREYWRLGGDSMSDTVRASDSTVAGSGAGGGTE